MQTNELIIVIISSFSLFLSAFVGHMLYRESRARKKANKNKPLYTKKLRSVGNAR